MIEPFIHFFYDYHWLSGTIIPAEAGIQESSPKYNTGFQGNTLNFSDF
jgi:hypothetical protein